MKLRRDRIEMILSILGAIQKGGGTAKPTYILYNANLSHRLMKQYLNELNDKGIIIKNQKDNSLMLTDTGVKFFSELKKMKRFVESFGL